MKTKQFAVIEIHLLRGDAGDETVCQYKILQQIGELGTNKVRV